MYTVQWCDHEGNLHKEKIIRLEDACAEANELKKEFEYVEIVDDEK